MNAVFIRETEAIVSSTVMKFISSRGSKKQYSFVEAALAGLADDGGLLMPEYIPTVNAELQNKWSSLSFPELCAEVLALFVDQKGDLLAFLQRKQTQTPPSGLIILAATSGDTGSAAIAALKSRSPLIHVVVLFPKDRTSEIQRLQMVTVQDPNIHCLQVNGTFDDCQRMVKTILSDKALQELLTESNQKLTVRDMSACSDAITPVNGQPPRGGTRDSTQTTTSASAVDGFPECRITWKLSVVNSINCVRILIQAAYWWYSALKMQHEYNSGIGTVSEMHGAKIASRRRCNIVVPTGNFGNIFSAFLAKQMGAPIGKLLLATNTNDVLCQAQDTGVYDKRRGVRATCSPSMDIAAASNFERLIFCCCGSQGIMRQIELTDVQRTQGLTYKQGRSLREKSSLPAEAQNKVPEHCLMGDANTPEDKRFERTSEEQFRSSGYWSSTLRAVTERFDRDGYARLSDEFLSFYRNNFLTEAVDDAETTKAIEKMYRLYGEIVDPHTAVGYAAYLKQASKLHGESQGFSSSSNTEGGQKDAMPTSSDPWLLAATAHFGKFPETVLAVVGHDKVDLIPLELRKLKDMPQRCADIGPSADSLKRFIVEKFTSSNKQMLGIDPATMDG
ncbi:UNVERIFIED_CONTAM: threonine synthase [Hammondia hammondi]|eukprot:XP_008886320.1 threonine synthase [Hammondia hammondi]